MERGRRGQLIDCTECWRLEERGMRRGGKGKGSRGGNPSLREEKREDGIWHGDRETKEGRSEKSEFKTRKRCKLEVGG